MSTSAVPIGGDDLDEALGERYYKGRKDIEDQAIGGIITATHQGIERLFKKRGLALRDAHAGDNGCVRAIFRVDPDLDVSLRHGVFVPGREYQAWIRFSNGDSKAGSSRWPDARGMAIKLMGVDGQTMLPDQPGTQDFILISEPAFFCDDLERYRRTLSDFLSDSRIVRWLSVRHLKGREIILAIKTNVRMITNPLVHQYWSMVPYRLGAGDAPNKTAVKYTAKPRLAPKLDFSDRLRALWSSVMTYLTPGFSLKKEMNDTLARQEMCFDFYVQRFVDQHRTPIEDSTTEWKEDLSRLEHVAQIMIPRQDLMSPQRARFCEDLSFSPWHGLPEHRPLGLVNRVRKRAYLEISNLRHRLNDRPILQLAEMREFEAGAPRREREASHQS